MKENGTRHAARSRATNIMKQLLTTITLLALATFAQAESYDIMLLQQTENDVRTIRKSDTLTLDLPRCALARPCSLKHGIWS